MEPRPDPPGTAVDGRPGVEEERLLQALRRGDEQAFATLVRRHSPEMVRLAAGHVPSHAVAEEVVQDTWLAVLRSLDRFEGRSSLRTWILRILVNRARTRGARERRSMPFGDDARVGDRTPRRDDGAADTADPPALVAPTADRPEQRLLADETSAAIRRSIAGLPSTQRVVITLRDVEGWDAAHVCRVLDLDDGRQRVLLHRARRRVRRTLAGQLAG